MFTHQGMYTQRQKSLILNDFDNSNSKMLTIDLQKKSEIKKEFTFDILGRGFL